METRYPETWSPVDERGWSLADAHGQKLANRYQALLDVGYYPADYSCDCFSLVHPNPKAPEIELWGDGQIVDKYPTSVMDGDRIIIGLGDRERFDRFIRLVPRPTDLQRLRRLPVGQALALSAAYIAIVVVAWGAFAILKAWLR